MRVKCLKIFKQHSSCYQSGCRKDFNKMNMKPADVKLVPLPVTPIAWRLVQSKSCIDNAQSSETSSQTNLHNLKKILAYQSDVVCLTSSKLAVILKCFMKKLLLKIQLYYTYAAGRSNVHVEENDESSVIPDSISRGENSVSSGEV